MAKTGFSFHTPTNWFSRTVISLGISALVGFVYFYLTLPSLNFHDERFYGFLALICGVYVASIFILSGGASLKTDPAASPKEKLSFWWKFMKSRCLPVAVLFVLVVIINLVGQVLSLPMNRQQKM